MAFKKVMKKIYLLALIMLLFSSCAKTDDNHFEAGIDNKNNHHDLYMVSNDGGLLNNLYAGTENGCYELLSGLGFHSNVIYTDYQSRIKIFLSSDAASDHMSDSSTSYISDTYSMVRPVATKNKLLVFDTGSGSIMVKKYGEKALSKIISMDFNGENKNKFYTFAANEWMHDTSGVACDKEDNLYFIESYLDEEGYSEKKNIVTVNINTGEKTELLTLDNIDRYFIIGAYGDELVLKKATVPDRSKPFYQQLDSQKIEIILLNVDTLKTEKITEFGKEEKSVLCHDNMLYTLNAGNGNINALNLSTGEEEVVYTIKDSTVNGVKYDSFSLRHDFYDGHILLDGIKSDGYTDFLAVDVNEKTVTKLELYSDDNFCGIFAENSEYFYVQTGEFTYKIEIPDPAGNTYTGDIPMMKMSLIKKADYWNNIPNFIEITDYAYGS